MFFNRISKQRADRKSSYRGPLYLHLTYLHHLLTKINTSRSLLIKLDAAELGFRTCYTGDIKYKHRWIAVPAGWHSLCLLLPPPAPSWPHPTLLHCIGTMSGFHLVSEWLKHTIILCGYFSAQSVQNIGVSSAGNGSKRKLNIMCVWSETGDFIVFRLYSA